MQNENSFPFHYGEEADNYTFYRIPKALFTNPELAGISTDAKLLYGLLLDRMQLSIKNKWFDESGRVYIYFTIEQLMEILHFGNKKVIKLMAELDDKKGVGLITRVRQGQGKADRIYVHKCVVGYESSVRSKESRASPVPKPYEYYERFFIESLELDILKENYKIREYLDEILKILSETCSSTKQYVRIGGEDKPISHVRGVLMELNSSHIEYVIESLRASSSDIRNIKQYLLTSLYNAPSTLNLYYEAKVNHDFSRLYP